MIARASGIPVHVAHEQTPFAREGGMRAWGRQIVVNRMVTGPFSDAVIVPSNWSKRALVEHEGVSASKIHVIPNGAPRRQSKARERDDVRAELGLPPGAHVAIVAAMLRPEKAQQLLIEAAAQLMDRWPSLQVVIAGGGPTGDPDGTGPAIAALSQELGIAARVHLLGHRTDVADLVAASDVAVLSSDHENLPLAVLEYMESGTPIVATSVGGVPELIEHGVHGLLVPARDQNGMATAIASILENPEAASRRAEAARIRRRSEFDWDSIALRVRALYERLLAQREPT
jgi:glycosyltransferase involved in cell wall biosynthesis